MVTKLKPVREGFTMIEMLITLVIISSLLVLVMVGGQRFSRSSLQTERAFWNSFDGYWKQALYEAQYHGRKTEITIEKNAPIIFRTDKGDQSLTLPRSLHPERAEKLLIRSNATISPRTVTFSSDVDQRKYRLVIQMGWGVYHVDREAA
ncbi:type II secretion system protein [Secundilactobacillus silagei]|uniref:Competence protein ComGD n=1 Tax=Secundilactobacillus silagei JCM 19001 TaxID=1302250 RepID=A0A1Z5IKA8_9LACO|nr:type II secretion system protein [Secundilactobacillus silagei]TDG68966.1 hypothetical protein C5L25_000320 [Secundilactobacillus silagei JCM 19001]GAX02203.1 hypothetical protein IWT126_02268 [Secundilactobacillus silagei JCM 19001]